MNSDFNVDFINEPKLLFADKGEAYNPCVGLIKYGPRFGGTKNVTHKQFKVGIIGSMQTIALTRNFFESFEYSISPKSGIKPWRIPFPGLNKNTPLKFSFSFDPSWESEIADEDFFMIQSGGNKNERANIALEIIENRMKAIYDKDPTPDIIIISIPDELFNLCTSLSIDKPKIKIEDDDFHNRIKLIAMKLKMPTQLLRPETLRLYKTQERFLIAWNLSVGMLYKCQKGHPWKLTHLEDNTCYIGISFFREKGEKTMRTSMAQIFLDTGESFVLRGDSFTWNNPRYPKSPHLSENDANKLVLLVLDKYYSIRRKNPDRIVIHKSSNFWEDELKGFLSGSAAISNRDFMTIQKSNLKFFTSRNYPVLRGTLILSKDRIDNYLFTTGFVSTIQTYPGFSIPSPLLIRLFHRDSEIRKIAEEILSFTKLDWNNTFVYSKLPVTLSVSRKVGNIMAESIAQEMDDLDSHYFYYM